MANHCVEIVCLKCGYGGCVRGCGTWRDKSASYASARRQQLRDWLRRYRYPNEPKKRFTLNQLITEAVKSSYDICPNCKLPMVMD